MTEKQNDDRREVRVPSEFPDAYFTHCNPYNRQAVAMLELRRHKYLVWEKAVELNADDYDELQTLLVADSGETTARVGDIISAFYRMSDLPKLHAFAMKLWHLDIEHWMAIDRAMHKAGDASAQIFSVIDDLLVDLLTPVKPAQQMVTKRTISNRINREIEALDSAVRTDKTNKSQTSRKPYGVEHIPACVANGQDSHVFRFDTDAATAVEIDAHIRNYAKQAGISLRDATVELLLGKAETSVTLNCYRATDVDDAPLFVATDTGGGVATVFAEAADVLAARAGKHYDMDATMGAVVSGYATTQAMRSAVTGRDGHCRYPGCNRPATVCQMDHVVEFAAGGLTSPSNVISLCQHHHNIKTDKRVRPIFEPVSGSVVWLFADGSWQSTEADGPLSAPNRRWVQSVQEKMDYHRQAVREEAKEQARRLEEQEENWNRKQQAWQAKWRQEWKEKYGAEYRDPNDDSGVERDEYGAYKFKHPWESFCETWGAGSSELAEMSARMTKTQEEQRWANNISHLERTLVDRDFAFVTIPKCRRQVERIREAIAVLRDNGPGSDADGPAHESSFAFSKGKTNAHTTDPGEPPF